MSDAAPIATAPIPNRKQLASFIKNDQQTVIAFEQLFKNVSDMQDTNNDKINAIIAAFFDDNFTKYIVNYLANLPKVEPIQPGIPWLNGSVVAISQA